MNINQLEYFIAVAEQLNFTKAAQKCFISQTAMTQQIKSLEKTVGTSLFIRDKHHVELTTAGQVFLQEARSILEQSNTAIRLARNASSGISGSIKIGYINGYGKNELHKILNEYSKTYPNIKVSLVRDNSSGLFEKIETGECDIIFTISPYRQSFPEMEHQYIDSYPLYASLCSTHPLVDKKVLTYSDLKNENFVIMQPANRPKAEAEECMLVFDRGGFYPNVMDLAGEPETLFLLVSCGHGISILPEYIIRSQKEITNLVFLPLIKEDGSAETMNFELSWSKQNKNPAIKQLLNIIKI